MRSNRIIVKRVEQYRGLCGEGQRAKRLLLNHLDRLPALLWMCEQWSVRSDVPAELRRDLDFLAAEITPLVEA